MAIQVAGVRIGAAVRFWTTLAVMPLGLLVAVYALIGRVVEGPVPVRLAVAVVVAALAALAWTQFVRTTSWWLVRVWLGMR
jgi:hypothetical protein